MVTFQVTPASLRDLADQLDTICHSMEGVGAFAAAYSAPDLGSPDVYAALQAFHDDWSNGLDRIRSKVSGLGERLRAAADGYSTTERRLETSATPETASP